MQKLLALGFALLIVTLAGIRHVAQPSFRKATTDLAAIPEQISLISPNSAVLQQKREGSFFQQGSLQMLANGCKLDNPLSEISEPNVFQGAVGYGPDWPSTVGPAPTDCDSMKMKNLRKTYEIAEPNFQQWHEYKPDFNVFPFTNGKSGADAPLAYSNKDETDLFDGHGGIIGLEDSMKWSGTPDSVSPQVYGKYANGDSKGMDHNVYAGGYKFPDY